jgi:hypothetical protein
MRFYFDIRDGVPARDRTGKEFERISAAIAHAEELAAEFRRQREPKGQHSRICVVSENGTVVHEEKLLKPTDDSEGKSRIMGT